MKLLKTNEACELLRCERRKLKRLARDNGLSRIRMGRFVLYREDELKQLISKNTH